MTLIYPSGHIRSREILKMERIQQLGSGSCGRRGSGRSEARKGFNILPEERPHGR